MELLQKQKIFYLGAGAMSEAMLKGLTSARLVEPECITVSNRKQPERLQELHQTYGVQVSQDRLSEIAEADIIVLAVKPFDLPGALHEIAQALTSRHLVISVVAGIATETLEDCLEQPVPVIRAMPNASSFVQASATALCQGRWATEEQMEIAQQLFAAIGTSVVVEEKLMDAVTGLSGSGPAYFYYVVEALLEAGKECGLPEETCRALLYQTLSGAALMLQETGKEPQELRRQVTSPNGTTMAGIAVLDQADVQQHFIQAVQRATARAAELGQQALVTGSQSR
jgi:pyrroline-5-carboxylate reductase